MEEQPKEKKKKDKYLKKEKSVDFDKERAKMDFFDPRGVQTLFRTLSRNHYNLLKMIDNKASIILTVNSIIISLVMGVLYIAPETDKAIIRFGMRGLIMFSMLSMIFAILSMLPHKYVGNLYKNSDYKGSLYAGNFAKQSLEDFMNEFDRIMKNGHTVYSEMQKDLYFLGRVIAGKQLMLMISTGLFIIGLAIMITNLISNGIGTTS